MVERLIIEGGSDKRNGSLRVAFYKLLSKEIQEDLIPKILMGNGKNESIKKYFSSSEVASLLIDLDNEELFREKDISDNSLQDHRDYVFYMIQEMEAWFLSQPDLLNSYYVDVDWSILDRIIVCEVPKPSSF